MSYTLRGRLESRFAALQEWWPVALVGTMIAVGLAFDLGYHPVLPYQPGWAALPLGLLELGVVLGVVLALGIPAPLSVAVPLFVLGWVAAQVLAHALLPLWRLSYAEDGGASSAAAPAPCSQRRAVSGMCTCLRPCTSRRACTRAHSSSTGASAWLATPAP